MKDFVPSHVPNMFLIMFPFCFHFFLLVLKYSLIYPIFYFTCSLCCSHNSHVVVKFIPCALSNVFYFVHMVPMPFIISHIFAQSPPITYSIGGSNGKPTLALCWACSTFEACFFVMGQSMKPIIGRSDLNFQWPTIN